MAQQERLISSLNDADLIAAFKAVVERTKGTEVINPSPRLRPLPRTGLPLSLTAAERLSK